jgi:hypothetical protein
VVLTNWCGNTTRLLPDGTLDTVSEADDAPARVATLFPAQSSMPVWPWPVAG